MGLLRKRGSVLSPAADAGFAITTLLLITSIASATIVGGSSTAAAVMNRADIVESADQMSYVAGQIRDRSEGDDSPRADAMRKHATEMQKTANMMTDQATDDVVVAVGNNLGDAILTPLQGGAVAVDAAKFLWDFKGGYELGDTAINAWGLDPDPRVDAVTQAIQELGIEHTADAPVEQMVIETKLTGAEMAVDELIPGLTPEELSMAATQLVINAEVEQATGGGTEVASPFDNPFAIELINTIEMALAELDGEGYADDEYGDDEYDDEYGDIDWDQDVLAGLDTDPDDYSDDYSDDHSGDGSDGDGSGSTVGPAADSVYNTELWAPEAAKWGIPGVAPSSLQEAKGVDIGSDLGGASQLRWVFYADGQFQIMQGGSERYEGTYSQQGDTVTMDVATHPAFYSEEWLGMTCYYDVSADLVYVVERFHTPHDGADQYRVIRLHRGGS